MFRKTSHTPKWLNQILNEPILQYRRNQENTHLKLLRYLEFSKLSTSFEIQYSHQAFDFIFNSNFISTNSDVVYVLRVQLVSFFTGRRKTWNPSGYRKRNERNILKPDIKSDGWLIL